MSLIKTLNKRGPRIDPWGTPLWKVYEKVIEIQLVDYFDKIFNPFLCAFRRGHGCQTTLLRLLVDF
jgi:hypothetical protein